MAAIFFQTTIGAELEARRSIAQSYLPWLHNIPDKPVKYETLSQKQTKENNFVL